MEAVQEREKKAMSYAEQLAMARSLVLKGTELDKNLFLRFLLWVHADARSKGVNVRKPAHTHTHIRGARAEKKANVHSWLSHG